MQCLAATLSPALQCPPVVVGVTDTAWPVCACTHQQPTDPEALKLPLTHPHTAHAVLRRGVGAGGDKGVVIPRRTQAPAQEPCEGGACWRLHRGGRTRNRAPPSCMPAAPPGGTRHEGASFDCVPRAPPCAPPTVACSRSLLAPSGSVDASLTLQHSMTQPVLGGWVRLSKGVAFLLPQGSAPQATSAAAAKDLQVRAAVSGGRVWRRCVAAVCSAAVCGSGVCRLCVAVTVS